MTHVRHRVPQKGPVLPPVSSTGPSSIFGLWQEASDGLNHLGDGSQQALDPQVLSRNARANFERDIMSQLQQDVKFTLLDRLDTGQTDVSRGAWQVQAADLAKGTGLRSLQAAGSVHDFPAPPLISNAQGTLPSISWPAPAASAMAPMHPTAPLGPPASNVRRPHPQRSSGQQVENIASRERFPNRQAPALSADVAAAETAAANAAADAAATSLRQANAAADMAVNSLRQPGKTGMVMPSAAANAGADGEANSLQRNCATGKRGNSPTAEELENFGETSASQGREVPKKDIDDDLEAKLAQALMDAEIEALEQTLCPHYVLVAAEKEVVEAALAIARMDSQQESPVKDTGKSKKSLKRSSLVDRMTGQGRGLLSFVPRTMRRCIQHGLVSQEQWKVLLESPLNSWYDPVLSRFPAAVVFADASGFTKLTESLAKQPQGAEKIGMTLNNFFGPLISIVQKHGGDIIKFSGDALTIIWAAAEPAPKESSRRVALDVGEASRSQFSESYQNTRRLSSSGGMANKGRRRSSEESNSKARRASNADDAERSNSFDSTPGDQAATLSLPKVVRKRRRSITESHCTTQKEVEMAASVAAVTHAASFCLEVQSEIHKFGRTPVPGCSLTMHIGVGFGDLALLQLGGLMGRWEYCIAGKALDQIAVAEPLAHSHETVFSPEARELAESGLAGRPQFEFEDVEDPPEDTPPGYMKLVGIKHTKTTDDLTEDMKDAMNKEVLDWWVEKVEREALDLRLVKRYVPSAVALRLACGEEAESVTYPEEMRRISVVFVSIAGLDPFSTESYQHGLSGGRKTQLLMRLMQRSVYALEGSVNKFLVDDKGVLLLVCFGLPPLIHFTDDPIRSVLCAMRLRDCLKDEGLQGRVGVATGNCWCGVVGTEIRREYTVLGDTVNLAARLMGKAPVNQVLVDSTTHKISSSVLEFDSGEFLRLKGKVEPVCAFRFLYPRRGLKRHRKAVETCLMSWRQWPARVQMLEVLESFKSKSGVISISGPGGGGKTELAEIVRKWTASRGWTLLAGQNMDPSGTFVLPRLSLQEAFQELVKTAAKDHFWRGRAWELLTTTLGRKATRHKRAVGMPTHAELYWMLFAMLQSSAGDQAAELENWMPLLSLVVTQMAFAPRMVSAMAERDEQHARNDRFAELCAHLMDGFSRHGSAPGGTVLLLHIRRSSAFFQSRDQQEASAIRALAELCMRRRREAKNQEELRPLLLVLVSRENDAKKDGSVGKMASECNGCIEAEDLEPDQTILYIEHLIRLRATASAQSRYSSKFNSNDSDYVEEYQHEEQQEPGRHGKEEAEPEVCVPPAHRDILSEYVYEMTGGNPLAVLVVFKQLCQRKVLCRDRHNRNCYRLQDDCTDAAWLRKHVPVSESLVGMAFSNFERLDPREQMVLKAATTFEGAFGVTELAAALPKIRKEDLRSICTRLASKAARAIRKAMEREAFLSHARCSLGDVHAAEEKYQFYSGLLRHAASTLVLEAQRTEVRRNSALALSALGLANLKGLTGPLTGDASPGSNSNTRASAQERASKLLSLGAFNESDEEHEEDDEEALQEEDNEEEEELIMRERRLSYH